METGNLKFQFNLTSMLEDMRAHGGALQQQGEEIQTPRWKDYQPKPGMSRCEMSQKQNVYQDQSLMTEQSFLH